MREPQLNDKPVRHIRDPDTALALRYGRGQFERMKNILRLCLVSELLCSAVVLILFRLLHPKEWAALWAGSLFVALGIGIAAIGARRTLFRRTWTWKLGLIHLFATALPMLAIRAAHYDEDFSSIRIYGLAGPAFHGLSEAVYACLILATLVDLWAARAGR